MKRISEAEVKKLMGEKAFNDAQRFTCRAGKADQHGSLQPSRLALMCIYPLFVAIRLLLFLDKQIRRSLPQWGK